MAAHDLGPLIHIAAEAIGQPGQRRFRIQALNAEGDSAAFWLEKEQLAALGEAIESVLENEGYQYQRQPLDDNEAPAVFPLSANLEIRVGQLSMGVDRDRQLLVLISAEATEEESEAQVITVSFEYRRGHELRRQILEVVAAGRPPCPLCTAPMDPAGHVCVRTNGHHPH